MKSEALKTTLQVMIVDDEEPARNIIKEYLSEIPNIKIVAECKNGFEAVKAASELTPDLIFLDIQMPKLDGFEVLEVLETDMAVIFVTAYDEHAVRAFDVHAVDYLLKPFDLDRLQQALTRARRRIGQTQQPTIEALANEARPDKGYQDRILVREGPKVHVINTDSVDYIEASDDTVMIQVGKQSYKKSQRLSVLEKRLDPGQFIRIHRSYILNLDRLSSIELYAKDSQIAILKGGENLPLSRSGYARLKDML